ncbi:MAG: type III-A CRISPR-associated RAMP protein Csm3 [Bacteroidales bacterium]|nr:type III-A CRISPR-associated RAMP protein Csm3 [Candidatus Colimorpha merdihippi]
MAHLVEKVIYKGIITAMTGLHIGGTNTSMGIGGPDKLVVRNPLTNIPYIPGSSLKGKMRSLIELKYACCNTDNKGNVGPSQDPRTPSGMLFGTAGKNNDQKHPSRVIFRDAPLIINNDGGEYGKKGIDFSQTDLPYTESKTEVSIDRVTSAANPRTFERVPAGAKFRFEMVLNVFEGEDKKQMDALLKEAIGLLENDYLGGNGSRGYGQVKFELSETVSIK